MGTALTATIAIISGSVVITLCYITFGPVVLSVLGSQLSDTLANPTGLLVDHVGDLNSAGNLTKMAMTYTPLIFIIGLYARYIMQMFRIGEVGVN